MKSAKAFTAIMFSGFIALSAKAQTWNNASANNLWYNAANWTPNTGPAGWTSISNALFTSTSTRTIGIDFSQRVNLTLAGIWASDAGAMPGTVTIGNNSSVDGTVVLAGSILGTGSGLSIVNNTAGNSGNLTLQTTSSLGFLFNPNNGGLISIGATIAGLDKNVRVSSSNSNPLGGSVEFTGANTYTGTTYIQGSGSSCIATLTLNRPGGATLPPTNNVDVYENGLLVIATNQTLNDVYVNSGSLRVNDNVTLTITGSLTTQPGRVQVIGSGKIVYAPGAELRYTGYNTFAQSTSNAEFPVADGPSSVSVSVFDITTSMPATNFSLHQNRIISGSLILSTPFLLGNHNFTCSATALSSAPAPVITNGTGKLYLTNVGSGEGFPIAPTVGTNSRIFIYNGQGLTYGIRVTEGHTPPLSVSNNAVNRTWYIEPSANTGTAPVTVVFAYNNTHGNPGFNTTNPVDVLKYKTDINKWVVQQANIPQTLSQTLTASVYNLPALVETPLTFANAGALPSLMGWNNGSTNNLWYDAANWTPNTLQAEWTEASTASFTDAGTRTVAIDFSQGDLVVNNITSTNTGAVTGSITVGNNSSVNGNLNIWGGIYTSALGTGFSFLNNTAGNSGNLTLNIMGSALVLRPYGATFLIDAAIAGVNKPVNITTTLGIGGEVELSGLNTYTGLTTIEGGGGASTMTLTLSKPGGGTLPATNDIVVGSNGRLNINTNQTLHNLTVGAGFLTINDNATLTITGKLKVPPGRVVVNGTGKIVYAPGATLEYAGSYVGLLTSNAEFPAVDGPTDVITNLIVPFLNLHANRTISGLLTAGTPLVLGANNFTAGSATGAVVTDGSGKLYISNVGAGPVTFPVRPAYNLSPNNTIAISNGQGLTYGVRVAVGHTPSLILSNNAVNRTWHVEPSATPALGPQAPVNISFSYDNAHVNAGFNLTNPVDVLQYNNGAGNWHVGHFNIPQPQPVAAAITGLTGSTELPLTIINTGLALAASDIILQCTRQSNGYGYINWDLKMDISTVKELQLEKSADGRHFTKISSYPAANANHIDADLFSGKNYYRLKVIYNNDKFEYSAIAAIINSTTGFDIVSLMPNIVTTTTQLNIASAKKTKVNVGITDMAGRPVYKQMYNAVAGSNLFTINMAHFSAGIYLLTGTTAEGEIKTVRLIKK